MTHDTKHFQKYSCHQCKPSNCNVSDHQISISLSLSDCMDKILQDNSMFIYFTIVELLGRKNQQRYTKVHSIKMKR